MHFLSILLVLTVSNLYRLGAVVGFETNIIYGFLILGISIFMFVLASRRLLAIVSRKEIFLTLLIFCLIPLSTAIFTYSRLSVEIIFRTFAAMILFLSAVFLQKSLKNRNIENIIFTLMVIQTVGALFSVFFPDLFLPMAAQADANLNYDQRAFGFQLQPNSLGIVSVFLFLIFYFLKDERRNNRTRYIFATLLTLIPVFLSGSRFAISLLVAALIFSSMAGIKNSYFSTTAMRKLIPAFAGFTILYFAILFVFSEINLSSLNAQGNIFDRFSSLLEFRIGHSGDEGSINSLDLRVVAQLQYINLIGKSPLFGYGLGAEKEFFDTGVIVLAAHSTALSFALQFGVPYLLLVFWIWARPLIKMKAYADKFLKRKYSLFLICTFASTFFNHGVFESGVLLFGYGIILSQLREIEIRQQMARYRRACRFSEHPVTQNQS